MTEHKKLIYQLEDTFTLGKQLPVVALRQLSKLAQRFRDLPDVPDYLPGTSVAVATNIETFVRTNNRYIDDERELKESFTVACKNKLFSHHYLKLFET